MQNLDSSLFNIRIPAEKPYQGCLLVAEPFLRQEEFNHAVIFLSSYNSVSDEKPMGIVLNKPTQYTLGQAIEGFDDDIEVPLFNGGPVGRDRMFFLHRVPDLISGGLHLGNGLYLGGDFAKVKDMINLGFNPDGKMRFFIGYAGWDRGQLEEEIRSFTWAVTSPVISAGYNILEDSTVNSLWHDSVKRLGPRYRNWLYHPMYPQLN